MGKRSAFERRAGDAYPTPIEAVLPLIPHLRGVRNFAEPCAGLLQGRRQRAYRDRAVTESVTAGPAFNRYITTPDGR